MFVHELLSHASPEFLFTRKVHAPVRHWPGEHSRPSAHAVPSAVVCVLGLYWQTCAVLHVPLPVVHGLPSVHAAPAALKLVGLVH